MPTQVGRLQADSVKIHAAWNNSGLVVLPNGTLWMAGNIDKSMVPPVGLNNVVDVAVGGGFCLTLREDGTVAVWGSQGFGVKNIPVGLSNVIAVAAGLENCYALKSDGTVVAWGWAVSPIGVSNAIAISVYPGFCSYKRLALKQDGTVLQWGWQQPRATIIEGMSNVVAIAAGVVHNLALKKDGTVAAWGSNAYGETDVPAGLTNVVAIAAGGSHPGAGTGVGFSLALRSDGTVVGWGRLGRENAPVVPAGIRDVVAIAAGSDFGIAATTNAAVAERFQVEPVLE